MTRIFENAPAKDIRQFFKKSFLKDNFSVTFSQFRCQLYLIYTIRI